MRAISKLSWVELKLFTREPFLVIFTIIFPLIVLVALAGSFVNDDPADYRGVAPASYYLASYVAVVIAAVGLVAVPVHLAAYRERQVLRRFQASSLPSSALVIAQVVVGFVMCVVGGVVLFVAGSSIYDTDLPEQVGQVLIAFVLGTAAFLALGILLGSLLPTARAAQAVGLILFFPLWLLSGAGPPPAIMSDFVRSVSEVLPLTFVVDALHDPWFGHGSATAQLIVLAGMAVVAGGLSLRLLRRG